jgi:hypothetical protein
MEEQAARRLFGLFFTAGLFIVTLVVVTDIIKVAL